MVVGNYRYKYYLLTIYLYEIVEIVKISDNGVLLFAMFHIVQFSSFAVC